MTGMPDHDQDHGGGCRCGAVRFAATAAPHHVSYCHCHDSRRATGAPVTAFVGFMANEVALGGDGLRTYENGSVTRSFCGVCGSPIAYVDGRIGDRIYFYLGVMDRPARYEPTTHGHVRSQLPFLHMPDGLPRHPGATVPRPNAEQSWKT